MAERTPKKSRAWLLTLDGGLHAAVGEQEMVHLIEAPALLKAPVCPFFCQQVLVWNERLLPAMNLAAWLLEQPGPPEWKLAGIMAYQGGAHSTIDYGALLLAEIPQRLSVSDEQACVLPEHPTGWRNLALSCFQQGESVVPILDLPHIFGGSLSR